MATERFDQTQYIIEALMRGAPSMPPAPPAAQPYTPSPYTMGLFGQLDRNSLGLQRQAAPMMTQGTQNPGIPMGAGLSQMPRSMGSVGMPLAPSQSANMPYEGSMDAGPAPLPPRRPVAPPPMPPQRPESIPYPPQRPGPEMGPGAFEAIRGFNPFAAAGNAQHYADQFAGGDLTKLAARTYRNEDGSMWNDYYLQNVGG